MKALITLAAIISAVFVAAPAALADAFITDTLGGSGHAKSTLQRYRLITDALGGSGQPQQATPGYRFITDTLAPGGGHPLPAPPSPAFSWSDAGVGAATAAGALFVLLGGTLLAARRRGTLAL